MKLWIIYSHKEENVMVTPEMMSNEAKKHGLPNELYFIDKFKIKETSRGKKLYYNNKVVRDLPNVILFRGFKPELTEYFTNQDVTIINNQECQLACKNKYEAHKALDKYVYQPISVLVKATTSYAYLKRRLKTPFILKDNFGEDGEAVFLVDNKAQFEKICADYKDITLIAQEYISVSKGVDIRAYVIGNKIYAMKRTNLSGGFQTNLSGGTIKAQKIKFSRKQKKLTLSIAKSLGIEVGCVDYLIDGRALVFMEANTNAGFLSYLRAGINIKKQIFKYIKTTYKNKYKEDKENLAKAPEYARVTAN